MYKYVIQRVIYTIPTIILVVSAIISGAVLTETVFTRPGVGKVLADAVFARDYTMVQVSLIVFTVLVVGVNLVTDISYGFLDPRIQLK